MIRADSMLGEPGLQGITPLSTRSATARPFIGREFQATALDSALGTGHRQGAIVVGQGGIGKSALVQNLLSRIPDATATHYLRGTTLTVETPYGILGLLIGRTLAGNFHSLSLTDVLAAMAKSLGGRDSGSTPIVVVDNAEHADKWSAMALAELVRTHTIRLIVVCRRVNGIPSEFSKLWRSGQLQRVDIPAMNASDARELICNELSAQCSLAVATIMWRESAGNPLYLRALVRQGVEDGTLVCVDGIWVWCDGRRGLAVPAGLGRVGRLINTSPGKTGILELVALAGTLSVATLMNISSAQELDDLLDSEDLCYFGSGKSTVSLAHPVLANVFPLTVSQEQSREWFATVEAIDPLAGLDGSELDRRMAWAAACAACVEVEPPPADDELAGAADTASNRAQAAWVALAMAVHQNGLAIISHEQVLHCSEEHAQWMAGHAEDLSMTGHQDDALELARGLAERLNISGNTASAFLLTAAVPAKLAAPLMRIYTISGEWRLLAELLNACHERGLAADVSGCIEFELASGIVQAFQGNQVVAAQLLGQGIAQLKHAPSSGWEALAHIARTGSFIAPRQPLMTTNETHGLLGMDDTARLSHLLETVLRDGGLPPLLVTLVQCMLASMLPAGSVGCGSGQFTRAGVLSMNGGADLPAQQMLILAAQVDGSHTEVCEDLLAIANRQEGALAEILGLYTKGLLTHDTTVLVQTVDRACHMNFPALAARAADRALAFASASSIRSVRRQLQRLVHLPADLSEPANELNAVLTEREEAVGWLAANGASNKEIAQEMGVSVRTVEGHLYQVYAKLQVGSRSELIPLLHQETA